MTCWPRYAVWTQKQKSSPHTLMDELFDKNLKEKYFQAIFYLVFSLVGASFSSTTHRLESWLIA